MGRLPFSLLPNVVALASSGVGIFAFSDMVRLLYTVSRLKRFADQFVQILFYTRSFTTHSPFRLAPTRINGRPHQRDDRQAANHVQQNLKISHVVFLLQRCVLRGMRTQTAPTIGLFCGTVPVCSAEVAFGGLVSGIGIFRSDMGRLLFSSVGALASSVVDIWAFSDTVRLLYTVVCTKIRLGLILRLWRPRIRVRAGVISVIWRRPPWLPAPAPDHRT